MDGVGSMRLVWVHRWFILIASAAGALLVGIVVALLPPAYSSTTVLRVVPPEGTLDIVVLNTAVNWYVSLGQVPDVLGAAGRGVSPTLAAAEVDARTVLAPGAGPGEINVTARASDPQDAEELSASTARAVVSAVAGDGELRIANTSLQLLVPAGAAGRAGPGAASMAAAAFLLLVVVLSTGVAVFGRRINWRLSTPAAEELAAWLSVPAFRVTADPDRIGPGNVSAAAALRPVVADDSVSIVTIGTAQTGSAGARVVAVALGRLGLRRPVVDVDENVPIEPGPAIYVVGASGSRSLALAARIGAPVAVCVARRARSRTVSRAVADLRALDLDVVAMLLLGAQRRSQPAAAAGPATAFDTAT